MRRRRAGLQVNTFPFLAVLLCAMGSLILLLLVIDRRAKIVARNKAIEAQELARLLDDTEIQKRREEWERQRHALHALLAGQHDQLKTQLKNLQSQTVVAAENLRLEHARHQAAEQALTRGKSDLERLRASMARWRDAIAQSKREDEKTNAVQQQAIQRLASELMDLERTLEALRLLRRRQEQAFSLVPYGGKRGDTRKPVYVECNRSGLTFYPQARTIPDHAIGAASIRAEMDKRAEEKGRAYLLFLVRPDGITAYTLAQGALRGSGMDYGYELVEPDWEFDFASEERLAAQPWRNPPTQVGIGPIGSNNAPRSAPPPLSFNRGGAGNGLPGFGNGKTGVGGYAGSNAGPAGAGLGFNGGEGNGRSGSQPGMGIGFGNGTKPRVGAFAGSNAGPTGAAIDFNDGDGNGTGRTPSGSGIGFGNGTKPGMGMLNNPPSSPGIGFNGGDGNGPGGPAIGSGLANGSKPGAAFPSLNGNGNAVNASQTNVRGYPGGQSSEEASGPWRSATRGWPADPSSTPGIGQGGTGQGGTGQGGIGQGGIGQGGIGQGGIGQGGIGQGGIGQGGIGQGGIGQGGIGQGGIGQGAANPGGQLGVPSIGLGHAGSVRGGPRTGGTESSEPGGAANAGAGPTSPTVRSSNQGTAGPWTGKPADMESSPRAGIGSPESSMPEAGPPSDDSRPSIGLPPPPDAEPGEGSGLPYLGGPRFGEPKPKTRPVVPLSRMLGNRDYPIVLECTEEALIIQPWGIRFENDDLPRRPDPNHSLVQTMNKLIARRQATVRQGEPPYRPVLRFQIRPGGLRSYYLAYPMLEMLQLPMTRENVQEEVGIRR